MIMVVVVVVVVVVVIWYHLFPQQSYFFLPLLLNITKKFSTVSYMGSKPESRYRNYDSSLASINYFVLLKFTTPAKTTYSNILFSLKGSLTLRTNNNK